ncbi:MAG: aminopeptidase [Armatimonadetes bacterium]|nr:aminopeptidase [Armatimonadota bacterium]
MPSAEKLQKLATLAIKCGIGLMSDQDLVIGANLPDYEFVRMVVDEAYRQGARSVSVLYTDDQTARSKFLYGSETAIDYAPSWLQEGLAPALQNGMAYLRLGGSDPSLLKDIDPGKVARSSKAAAVVGKPISEAIVGGATNWCIVPCVSPRWAKHVYPDLAEAEAVEKLWDVVFATTRADQPDPVAAWKQHVEQVKRNMDRLNSYGFQALRFQGPGTDLTVGLADGHVWCGVESFARNGAVCSPNIPTEEVFTMPHRNRVEGHVRSTKPLSLRGQVLDGIQVTFKDGAVTSVCAEQGEDVIKKLIETDEGARRLGEVALVPHSSPVSQTGLLFFDTLFDENAASHIALGRAYADTMCDYFEIPVDERSQRGANDSLIHVDWMIGSDEVDVDGIGPDNQAVPVMRKGEWAWSA